MKKQMEYCAILFIFTTCVHVVIVIVHILFILSSFIGKAIIIIIRKRGFIVNIRHYSYL